MQARFPGNFTPVEPAFLDLRVKDMNTLQAGVKFSARKDGSSATDTSYQRPDSARLSQWVCARAH